MPDISQELDIIENDIYGRNVKQAIHDALYKINEAKEPGKSIVTAGKNISYYANVSENQMKPDGYSATGVIEHPEVLPFTYSSIPTFFIDSSGKSTLSFKVSFVEELLKDVQDMLGLRTHRYSDTSTTELFGIYPYDPDDTTFRAYNPCVFLRSTPSGTYGGSQSLYLRSTGSEQASGTNSLRLTHQTADLDANAASGPAINCMKHGSKVFLSMVQKGKNVFQYDIVLDKKTHTIICISDDGKFLHILNSKGITTQPIWKYNHTENEITLVKICDSELDIMLDDLYIPNCFHKTSGIYGGFATSDSDFFTTGNPCDYSTSTGIFEYSPIIYRVEKGGTTNE